MKKLILLFCILISVSCYSQSGKYCVPVSKLTEIMLAKNYSLSEREELNKYPSKLSALDYIYSKSFKVMEHQQYTAEQFEKIDINQYALARKLDENVLVLDNASGLQLMLYSLNKMEADKKALLPVNLQQADPSGKIAR